MTPAPVDAVLFDLDDTLVDHSGPVRTALLAHLGRVAPEAPPEEAVAEWRRLESLHYGRYIAGELTWQGQRRARVHDMLRWLGRPPPRDDAEADAWFAGVLTGMEAAFVVFTDTLAALESLAHVRTGVVTNNQAENTAIKMARVGLGEAFPVVVCAGGDLPGKPDPAIFLAGCRALGSEPARTAYVGDRLSTDAVGARDAGLVGVWLDRHGDGTRELPDGVVRVTSLQGVVDLVAGGAAAPRLGVGRACG
jgi:putative hydrolase of the HAD superfamily